MPLRQKPGARDGAARRTRLSSSLLLLAALVIAAPSTGCGGGEGGGGKKGRGAGKGHGGKGGPGARGGPKKEAALAVNLATVVSGDIVRAYEASGTLEAILQAEIRSTQSGIIVSLEAEEGDTIERNAVLARLDGRDLSLMAKRDELTAKNAALELDRLEQIAAKSAASEQEVDQQRFTLESAKASARISRHQAGQSKVKAPFDGTITERRLDVGNFASSADVLYVLADLSVLELALHIPEREAARVKLGAKVSLNNLADEAFAGEVVRRAPVVDPLTGTIKFTVHVKGERPESAVPGAFARAAVELETVNQVPTLPDSALVEIDGEFFAYRIAGGGDHGEAERVSVTLGLRGQERSQVLSGLKVGDIVVADAREITDGMALKRFGAPEPDAPEGESGSGGEKKGKDPHAQGEGKGKGKGKGKRG
jgi:membrane fusion protein (multidrug efflux system)